MEKMLLVDHAEGFFEMDLNEASDSGRIKFSGKFQEANAVNKNKRMYTFEVLNREVKKLKPVMENSGLIGELDHPADSIIHFANASHKITKLWWDNNVLMGEGEILNTPHGKVLRALINDGVRVGISSRGVGSGKVNENGVLVIGESYKLITFDAVADPSTFEAFQRKVKSETHIPPENYDDKPVKNNSSSIHKVNKDALVALLGGIVKEHTANLKRGN